MQNYDLATMGMGLKDCISHNFTRGYFYILKHGKPWQTYDWKLLRILRWKDDWWYVVGLKLVTRKPVILRGSWKNGESFLLFWEFKMNAWRGVEKKRNTSESDAVLIWRLTAIEEKSRHLLFFPISSKRLPIAWRRKLLSSLF